MNADLGAAVRLMVEQRAERRRADWVARRESRARFTEEHRVARDAGLRVRHATKLARIPKQRPASG